MLNLHDVLTPYKGHLFYAYVNMQSKKEPCNRVFSHVMFRLSDLSNGFPDNATEKAGEMEQQTARDLSGDKSRQPYPDY